MPELPTVAPPGRGEWYADGLRFSCTQCGNCCTGPPGAVWFTEDEGRAMAAAVGGGIDEREFYRRYARREQWHDSPSRDALGNETGDEAGEGASGGTALRAVMTEATAGRRRHKSDADAPLTKSPCHPVTQSPEWSLKERLTEHGYDCIFLDRTTIPGKAVCSIYAARPKQCRTWPFWPEMLRSKRSWESYKRNTPCPGMNTGKLIPIEAIRIQRDA